MIGRWRSALGLLLGGAFLGVTVALIAASVRRPTPPVFALRVPAARPVPAGVTGPDTITLDVRDDRRWVRFDLARRRVAGPGEPWDIGFRRHRLIVNGGPGFVGTAGVHRLRDTVLDFVTLPDSGYHPSRLTPDGDSVHDGLDDWYAYGFFSHLLLPEPAAWAVRTADGRQAVLRILGYYCPGPEAGCMTFVYRYQGDGNDPD